MTNQEALKSIVEDGINLGAGDYVELEALILAKEALEKQIPKKPIIVVNDVIFYEFDGKCPNCGRGLYEKEHHCKCGQSLDWWSEE